MYLVQDPRTSPPARVISGHSQVHHRLDARQRAAIAADILTGHIAITLSIRQLAHLASVSAPSIRAASQPSPEMRQSIADGESSMSFDLLLKSSSEPLALPFNNLRVFDLELLLADARVNAERHLVGELKDRIHLDDTGEDS
jgi:hypothetical protein